LEKQHYGEKHAQIARSCLLIGIELREHEHYEEALKYLFEALKIDIECFGEEHPRVAKIYQALGNTYNNNEEYKQAMKYFNLAKEINKKHFGEESFEVQEINRSIGNIFYNQNHYEQALRIYETSLHIVKRIRTPKNLYEGILFTDVGNCLALMNNKEKESMENLQQGIKILTKLGSKDKLILMDNFFSKGVALKGLKHDEESCKMLKKAYVLSKECKKNKSHYIKQQIKVQERRKLRLEKTYDGDMI